MTGTPQDHRLTAGGDKESWGVQGKSFTWSRFIPKPLEAAAAEGWGDGEGKNLQLGTGGCRLNLFLLL
jgi:hypothetical protein